MQELFATHSRQSQVRDFGVRGGKGNAVFADTRKAGGGGRHDLGFRAYRSVIQGPSVSLLQDTRARMVSGAYIPRYFCHQN